MTNLRETFTTLPATRRVLAALRPGSARAAGGLWGGSAALLVAALEHETRAPVLVVTADDADASTFAADLAGFAARPPRLLREQHHDVEGRPEPQSAGERIATLRALAGERRFLVVAGLRALLQPVPNLERLARGHVTLARGRRLQQEDLLTRALAAGLRRVPVVAAPGEVSARGDVLDLYPLGALAALRLEFTDDHVESIRTFDPATQLSREQLDQAELMLGGGTGGGAGDDDVDPIVHVHRRELLVVRWEPLRILERQQTLVTDPRFGPAAQRLADTARGQAQLDVASLPSHDLDFKILSAGSAAGSGEVDPIGRLRSIRGLRGKVVIYCRTAEERRRLEEVFAHKQVDLAAEQVTLALGSLSRGFRVSELEIAAISNVEFAGMPQLSRVVTRPTLPSRAIASFFELGPGDLVVHAAHGIARFEGIELVRRGDAAEDHLRLTFRDDVKLLVPASKIHLVQKYVGAGEASPKLDKLGSKGFQRRKEEVEIALFDLASDLLEVQAQRERIQRPAYPRDPLEDQFLDGFPFVDTPDQRTSWQEIRADLERPAPMDRLLCGDVGFGKTELAMRAAFKVAIAGRQVALLAPTTVLAEQHHDTLQARFSPFALRVDVLSRYRTAAARKQLVADLLLGKIDVLVGTHAVLGKDVEWHDLGLVIVDEEQRFGVRHKEQLKHLRVHVDVLTLSATPIPRTLHASLLGIRAISTLATPPPNRQEVETHLVRKEPAVMAEALQRELARGGQVFVLHNRVQSLGTLARQLERLVPGARIEIGHGQMTATQIEHTIHRFVKGEVDVLVSTTIVENGLDLPNANTILIDRPELFGLAELHQLRGRVGRSERQAYCLLLVDPTQPVGEEARKRLKALEEMSALGAGFAIAMKDLEIRGAGNLLGPQQSGHIASVGYEMYGQLLRGAVESAKRATREPLEVREVDVDLRVQAFVPEGFEPDPKARLELLREMDGAVDPPARERIEAALHDRFGKLPPPLLRLLDVFLLKHLLELQRVRGVQYVGEDRVVVHHRRGEPLGGAWLDAFADVRPVEAGKTHLLLGRAPRGAKWQGERVLQRLLDALLGRIDTRRIRRR